MDPSVFEIMLHQLDSSIFNIVFTYQSMSFGLLIETVIERGDTKTINDENKLYNLKQSLVVTCRFLLKEARIKEEGIEEKVLQIRNSNIANLDDLLVFTVKALLGLNYSERIKDMMVEQLFVLFMFHTNQDELFAKMRRALSEGNVEVPSMLDTLLSELAQIPINKDYLIQWRKKYSEIIDWIILRRNQSPIC